MKIVLLYPDLLGTYGDSGNGEILYRRAVARGINATYQRVFYGDPIPRDGSLFVIGGGEDGPMQLARDALHKDGFLGDLSSTSHQILAVCAGLQILGESFVTSGAPSSPGLGLIPIVTERIANHKRIVGEMVAEADPTLDLPVLTGYENHGGESRLLSGVPLGRVVRGTGNSYASKVDGYIDDRIVATYMHGPLLARNPLLADLLIRRVAPVMPNAFTPLAVDREVDALRSEILSNKSVSISRRLGLR
ncbi:MAG: glutamine amidotransferase [Actinomycetota bacterium]|nr:glutamine amidotransferase [Actinomycetota bacterium]